jgi:hypothetical protein
MSMPLTILFAVYVPMWLIGFIWQFRVKHILRTAYPEEYDRIYSDPFQKKYKNDLRFARYLICRKYRALTDFAIVRHLDAFRIYIFAFLLIFLLTGIFFFMNKKENTNKAVQITPVPSGLLACLLLIPLRGQ